MLSIGLLAVGGYLYWTEHYVLLFWLIVLAIGNGGLAVVTSYRNPRWFWAKFEKESGVDFDPNFFSDPPVPTAFYVNKAIVIAIEAAAAWHVGTLVGYF